MHYDITAPSNTCQALDSTRTNTLSGCEDAVSSDFTIPYSREDPSRSFSQKQNVWWTEEIGFRIYEAWDNEGYGGFMEVRKCNVVTVCVKL